MPGWSPDGGNWNATVLLEHPDAHERKRQAVRAGAGVKLSGNHAHDPAHVTIAPETLASLAGDLKP